MLSMAFIASSFRVTGENKLFKIVLSDQPLSFECFHNF